MYDNNLKREDIAENLLEDKGKTCILLNDLAGDYEGELYNLNIQLRSKINSLQEKEQELNEIERTKVHNLDMFSPIYNKTTNVNELISNIELLKEQISELDHKKQILTSKVSALKNTVKYIEAMNINSVESEQEEFLCNRRKLSDKGLGILEAQEIERQRIARDLHDSTVQNLTSLVHKSELCIKLIDVDVIRSKLELGSMSKTLKMIINDMRGIIYNLKPMTLDDLGLTITVQRYANRLMNLNSIHIKITSNEETKEILPVIKLTLFRVIQEACNNIVKHANATIINIDIFYEECNVKVTVKDNGKGFNTENVPSYNSEQFSSFGLSIMKERILLLSGTLDIISEEGKGTIINVSVPLTVSEGGER